MKKLLFIFFYFLFFKNFIFSEFLSPKEIEDINNLIKNNEYQQVLEKLSKWEVYSSTNPQISYYLGIANFKLKNYKEAERFFELCLKNGYKTKELFYNLAVTKYKLKKYKEAVEYFKNLENDFYLEPESLYISISCYLKLQDKQQALNTFKKLISKYPYSVYVIKSQNLLDKTKVDYSSILYSSNIHHKFIIFLGYGKDTNIGYVPQQYYKDLELSNVVDNFFSYYIYASIFTQKFYSYYKYSAKNHSNSQNSSYNYLSHMLFLSHRFYKEDNISFIAKFLGSYYEYEEPYTYNLTGGLDLEFLENKHTSFQINYSYTTNDYFSNRDYLKGPQHSVGLYLNHTKTTKLNLGVSFKFKDTISDFVSSEYNYSYFILIGTSTYLRNVYTPLVNNYSYKSVSFEGLIDQEISKNINFSLYLAYEYYKYTYMYEYYNKINGTYLLDLNEYKWFIYTQNGWTETQQPQLKKVYKERIDNILSLSPSFSFKLTENLEFVLNYNYILSNSTIKTYQWTKEVSQAYLKIYF